MPVSQPRLRSTSFEHNRIQSSRGIHAVMKGRFATLRVAFGLLLCFLSSCADSARPIPAPSGQPMQRFTVLTYNTLHGLEPSGLTVKASESKEARQARLDLQFQQLSVVQPDVMLLQEVNPLPEM